MEIISTIAELRARLEPLRRAGQTIGFVPTMGYLHAGHMALVEHARNENDCVVASIFVNPLQFGKNEDFSNYPRDLKRDGAMLSSGGVDYLFAPSVTEMYPRPMETTIDVPKLGARLEGAVRPGHFAGVVTVVTKLFNIVGPTRAYFGEKDYQQLQIIRRMVDDLAEPVSIIGVATVREKDGLAFSSRNIYLSPAERQAAGIMPKALAEAERLVCQGETDPERLESLLHDFILREPLAHPEVIAVRDPETLEKPVKIGAGAVLLLLFVRFGATKLLDNRILGAANGKLGEMA